MHYWRYFSLSAIFICLVLRLHVFTLDIQGRHSWRQCKTMLNIRNFAEEDANILNPRVAHFNQSESNIVRFEFPLMQWSIAMVVKSTSKHIIIVRLCMFAISLMSLLAMFKVVKKFYNSDFLAHASVWMLSFSPVFFYQSLNPLPDLLAFCFALWFIYFFLKSESTASRKNIFLMSIFLCLAALCKLPFILFGMMPFSSFLMRIKPKNNTDYKSAFSYAFIVALINLPVAIWYGTVIPDWSGNDLTKGIFDPSVGIDLYMDFLNQQLTDTIPRIVTNYALITLSFIGLYFSFKTRNFRNPINIQLALAFLSFLLYFLYVLKQIREGHDYYHLPFLAFYILIALAGLKNLLRSRAGQTVSFVLLASMPFLSWNVTSSYWNVEMAYFNEDFFIHREALKTATPKIEKCIMVNDRSFCIVPYCIDKQGYIFNNDHLPTEWIEDLIRRKDIRYLYSDSRIVESQQKFTNYVNDTILTAGSIHVFRLKDIDQLE